MKTHLRQDHPIVLAVMLNQYPDTGGYDYDHIVFLKSISGTDSDTVDPDDVFGIDDHYDRDTLLYTSSLWPVSRQAANRPGAYLYSLNQVG